MSKYEELYTPRRKILKALSLTGIAIIVLMARPEAWSQDVSRSGKEVVVSVCVQCHGTGEKDAPKIGDAKAWNKRASQGLTTLTKHAIDGIRKMPGHGGNPSVSDFEITRAITYMVNQSGGSWIEPLDKEIRFVERSGAQIVKAQCSKCHQTGENGAPKIGDQAAWVLRLKQGLDAAVRSAINGHGGMPPRGGMANLTDTELRSAVIYMYNPGTVSSK